jgi:hypothetical protein
VNTVNVATNLSIAQICTRGIGVDSNPFHSERILRELREDSGRRAPMSAT